MNAKDGYMNYQLTKPHYSVCECSHILKVTWLTAKNMVRDVLVPVPGRAHPMVRREDLENLLNGGSTEDLPEGAQGDLRGLDQSSKRG
jgi:hypothetical protein